MAGGINLYGYVGGDPINKIDPKGLISFGGGFYWGGGADISLNTTHCCENGKQYEVAFITVCGGVGVSVMGKLPTSGGFGGISSTGNSCPRTRYYYRHETTMFFPTAGVSADNMGVSADVGLGVTGLGTSWKFCSDSVNSKKLVSDCCK